MMNRTRSRRRSLFSVRLCILPILCLAGCVSMPPLPPANLREPGWTVRQGQAIWRLPKGGQEVAGEVLLATKADGRSFVQFTKSPFVLVVAQSTPAGWEAEFPPAHKRYSAPGTPPKSVIWLHLPRVLAGDPPPPKWTWTQDSQRWSLRNTATGESLEGFFDP